MARTTQCGDRRCTLDRAGDLVRTYRDGYTVQIARLSKSQIDSLDPSLTRVKTEIDEIEELIEKAKKRGAVAWRRVGPEVQKALERLAENFRKAFPRRVS